MKHCAKSDIFVVSNTNDSGNGSFRSALKKANRCDRCRKVQILFAISGEIVVLSDLPTITKSNLLIEANVGGVRLNFNNTCNGLIISKCTNHVTIIGLALLNSISNGISLYGSHTTITTCYIASNKQNGVLLSGKNSHDNHIGTNPEHISGYASNVISNNGENGILVTDAAHDNIFISNFIGTDPSGETADGNTEHGISITNGAHSNRIGGPVFTNSDGQTNNPTGSKGTVPPVTIFPPQGNLISGNNIHGVYISSQSSINNVLNGNFIGVDISGKTALPNGTNGVFFEETNNNSMIGCKFETEPFVFYNVVSGNNSNGIHIHNSNNITIQGNFVGAGMDNASLVPNGHNGILVSGSSTNTTIGGLIPLGNVVSGNTAHGIKVTDTVSDFITFNTFGGLFAFGGAAPNGGDGLYVDSKGQGNVARTNVFSGNLGNGITLQDAVGFTIESVIVGCNTTGSAPLPNGKNGLLIAGKSTRNIIGKQVDSIIPGNTFSGNARNGILIKDDASMNQFSRNLIGLNSLGKVAIPNGRNGIMLMGNANNNYIGPETIVPKESTNYISGNGTNGIYISSESCFQNVITLNHVGFNINEEPLKNGVAAIIDMSSSGTNAVYNNFVNLS